MTDVSVGFRPPGCQWAPAWRLHTNLCKLAWNFSAYLAWKKNAWPDSWRESLHIHLLPFLRFCTESILNVVTLKYQQYLLLRMEFICHEILNCVLLCYMHIRLLWKASEYLVYLGIALNSSINDKQYFTRWKENTTQLVIGLKKARGNDDLMLRGVTSMYDNMIVFTPN